ncbi:MAG: hypothetical protein HRT89_14460 [Lentisphaeria bacterium]|nr:hypothetical protein [Lentisphaeria bacterium]
MSRGINERIESLDSLDANPVSDTGLRLLLYFAIGISVLPFFLNIVGVDFSSNPKAFPHNEVADMSKVQVIDAHFNKLSGAFTHTILEWSAFCVAMFTALLAFTNMRITKDITVPIIGLALFMSGFMDAFHTLAADRLIHATAPNTDLVPFTWAICRAFNALIMKFGVIFILVLGLKQLKSYKIVIYISLIFGVISYAIIHYCASSDTLPKTMFSGDERVLGFISRPYDVFALIFFLINVCYVYPKFYKAHRSLFAASLWISAIPDIATQVHMSFGSTSLFDNHFNIAHFLKIMSYLIPCLGLLLDYMHTYKQEQIISQNLDQANIELKERTDLLEEKTLELEQQAISLNVSNEALERFAYVASHDLQEPLRTITSYIQLLEGEYKEKLSGEADEYIEYIVSGSERMKTRIKDLLSYSRLTQVHEMGNVDLNNLIAGIIADLKANIFEQNAVINYQDLPVVHGSRVQLETVFQNLITNALKYNESDSPTINISSSARGNQTYQITVSDNGIGFDPKHADKIFEIFQRFHNIDEHEGTGIGLSICRRIIESHNGSIQVDSIVGEGSVFKIVLPTLTDAKNDK